MDSRVSRSAVIERCP